MEYRITDWAGNIMFEDKRFNSFEDGWDYIYEHVDDIEMYDDIYVEEVDHESK